MDWWGESDLSETEGEKSTWQRGWNTIVFFLWWVACKYQLLVLSRVCDVPKIFAPEPLHDLWSPTTNPSKMETSISLIKCLNPHSLYKPILVFKDYFWGVTKPCLMKKHFINNSPIASYSSLFWCNVHVGNCHLGRRNYIKRMVDVPFEIPFSSGIRLSNWLWGPRTLNAKTFPNPLVLGLWIVCCYSIL